MKQLNYSCRYVNLKSIHSECYLFWISSILATSTFLRIHREMAFDLRLCLYRKHVIGFQSNRNCTNFSRYVKQLNYSCRYVNLKSVHSECYLFWISSILATSIFYQPKTVWYPGTWSHKEEKTRILREFREMQYFVIFVVKKRKKPTHEVSSAYFCNNLLNHNSDHFATFPQIVNKNPGLKVMRIKALITNICIYGYLNSPNKRVNFQ